MSRVLKHLGWRQMSKTQVEICRQNGTLPSYGMLISDPELRYVTDGGTLFSSSGIPIYPLKKSDYKKIGGYGLTEFTGALKSRAHP